jgi:Glycosyl transferase family group 2
MARIEDKQKKWWSESHVLEDFEMSLRLQIAGWRVRYATYHGEGFQEGVSLTIYDELRLWQKYSYGSVCSILVRLTKGGTHISSNQKLVAKGTFYPSFYRIPQSGH